MHEQLTIDILLNPSVHELDEERLAKHVRSLYLLFWARHTMGLPVSTLDLEDYGKAQYNARLYELRQALIPFGQCIDKLPREERPQAAEKGVHYYKLVPLAESTYYKQRKDKCQNIR